MSIGGTPTKNPSLGNNLSTRQNLSARSEVPLGHFFAAAGECPFPRRPWQLAPLLAAQHLLYPL